MHIQPVASQSSYKGKLHLKTGVTSNIKNDMSRIMCSKFKEVATMVSEKPYDLFISQNMRNPEFFDIAANKSFEEAQKIKEYTVKVQSNIIATSIIDAAKDAMEMYEKYISRNIKG